MKTIKLSVTHRGRLVRKYGQEGLGRIDRAVASWVDKDSRRGIDTIHVALDDPQVMARYAAPPVVGAVTPAKVKKAVDGLFKALSPDYLVLMGSSDVLPHFTVANPSFAPVDGDLDEEVPTDNPYACSRPFVRGKRESYLIPDRVVGRIPDLPGRTDPAVLVDYLASVQSWTPGAAKAYADDLLLCCDSWKASGRECAAFLTRQANRLLVSPPAIDTAASLRKRHAARLHMIKCHGALLDSRFYGQKASAEGDFPIALTGASLAGRVAKGTVVGAMCCYGGLVFDPDDDAAQVAGALPIPTVYLQQGAYGFVGSTTIAWVGPQSMVCADWVIAAFLRETLRGASLGRALLEAKQDFVRFIDEQGAAPDIGEEKTLLQFYLLGDPSIHAVAAAGAVLAAAGMRGRATAGVGGVGAPQERRARREYRHQLAEQLRATLPQRVTLPQPGTGSRRMVAAAVKADPARAHRGLVEQLAKGAGWSAAPAGPCSIAHRVVHEVAQPEIEPRRLRGVAAAVAARVASPVVRRESIQYYWTERRERGPVREIRMIKVETDPHGGVLRTRVLVSC